MYDSSDILTNKKFLKSPTRISKQAERFALLSVMVFLCDSRALINTDYSVGDNEYANFLNVNIDRQQSKKYMPWCTA